jgi:small subunit ribosomal protein S21
MAEVHLQDGETIENALILFKQKVIREQIIKEAKRRSYYLKPGDKKRRKSELARQRDRKNIAGRHSTVSGIKPLQSTRSTVRPADLNPPPLCGQDAPSPCRAPLESD